MWPFSRKQTQMPGEVVDEENILYQKIAALDKFPGNLAEYNAFRNAKHAIMDTEDHMIYVCLGGDSLPDEEECELLTKLIEKGCKGLIYYNLSEDSGVPVKREF